MAVKRVGQKIKMKSVDELLCVPSVTGCEEIEVAKIHPFKDHPFKVLDDEKMHELVESIMLNGILVPVTVRQLEDGDYEMISGHRRLHAVKVIGLERIPAIVKDYDDDEAILAMVVVLPTPVGPIKKIYLHLPLPISITSVLPSFRTIF